ncbi:hypothetical protein [Kitasatospora griseola]|uniref:hypothetical protein n=1 Tax=Kitasatospora griseola TaxID=2064 RepID=UPI001670BDA4|nr:hypothetical protein [Kitasatospora griseola]GGR01996.1 hypothetical protein GCM10010195_67200 [Kitasatospora griseola]
MDLAATLSGMPGAKALPGLPQAWHWSPNPRFHFAAALTDDQQHVLQINTMGTYDEELVGAALAFAREHTARITDDPRPLIPLTGFTTGYRDFDTVAVASPAAHTYHARENQNLHQATYAVFPGWHYEFSGTETAEEAQSQVSHPQGLRVTNLDRDPVPFLKMSYKNTTTRSHSTGKSRALTKPDVLLRELELLDGAEDSFVEFENFRNQVYRVEWEKTYILHTQDTRSELDRPAILAFAQTALTT